jgi:hypothetical protein
MKGIDGIEAREAEAKKARERARSAYLRAFGTLESARAAFAGADAAWKNAERELTEARYEAARARFLGDGAETRGTR